MSLRYMLDTNVVSHIMQGRDAGLLARLTGVPVALAVVEGDGFHTLIALQRVGQAGGGILTT
jgi:hypothetical protein